VKANDHTTQPALNKPLTFGIGASVAFFGLYFLTASWIGWQNPAPWESAIGETSRWCERVAPGAFREPVNALSNIGFMVAGLWMLWMLGRDEQLGRTRAGLIGFSPTALVYAGAAWFLGPGSLMMHGTHAAWGGWLDNLSMVMYILIPWLLNLSQMGQWTVSRFLWIYAAIVVVYAVLRGGFGWGLGIGLDLFGLSIGLWVITESLYRFWSPMFRWLSGFVGFLVALIFGTTPLEMWADPGKYWWVILFWLPALIAREAPVRRRAYWPWFFFGVAFYLSASVIWQTGKPSHAWCDPDSLIQAHGIWHLMTAVATVCFFIFLRTERVKPAD
jgi:hypothetical protein